MLLSLASGAGLSLCSKGAGRRRTALPQRAVSMCLLCGSQHPPRSSSGSSPLGHGDSPEVASALRAAVQLQAFEGRAWAGQLGWRTWHHSPEQRQCSLCAAQPSIHLVPTDSPCPANAGPTWALPCCGLLLQLGSMGSILLLRPSVILQVPGVLGSRVRRLHWPARALEEQMRRWCDTPTGCEGSPGLRWAREDGTSKRAGSEPRARLLGEEENPQERRRGGGGTQPEEGRKGERGQRNRERKCGDKRPGAWLEERGNRK